MSFLSVLEKYRKVAFSERDKGDRFERLIQAYLQTDPQYVNLFDHVWMWSDFPYKDEFGGKDTGIDLVALTLNGDYWAVQCKCYQEDSVIDKPEVDSFLSTSSRSFKDKTKKTINFSYCLWVSTTNKWTGNAEESIRNQTPPVIRRNLLELEQAPVDWDILDKGIFGDEARIVKKVLKDHQTKALDNAHDYFKKNNRGKLIMACGTGKTFTSLKIAEHETKGTGLVLFLVPSIGLLGQSLREWVSEANEPIDAICICSDPKVSRKQNKLEESDGYSVVDLALPASTNINDIVKQFNSFQGKKKKGLTVVFSTYQSINVISEVQKKLMKSFDSDGGIFDLIICDEAHRTTGVTLSDEDESSFVKVHNDKFIKAKKRLYMTATPRLFNDESKSKADEADAVLCSMDDPTIYGDEIYRIGFGEAVEKDLLSDYKVLILTVSESDIPASFQKIITNKENEITTDDVSKLIGCLNALSKNVLGDDGTIKATDPEPMKRAVAFCRSIKDSEDITDLFNQTKELYNDSVSGEMRERLVTLSSAHVDGTMSALKRDAKLLWLKDTSSDSSECRILTNARCLSEGIDVPTLDAVLFLSARNSQVDVVQSVGRVMRKSNGKKYGYIIIPVVVPANIEADKALSDNERYKVVWSVLNALRAHDDRFNATINKIDLNKKKPNSILVGGVDNTGNDNTPSMGEKSGEANKEISKQLTIQFQELQNIIYARMVKKVGDRYYWEQWAKDVAQIAEKYIERINRLIKKDKKHQHVFEEFLEGLQKNINPSVTEKDAVEMLSQHIITKPVFEALFKNYSFVKNNPISVSMQKMIDLLEEQAIEKDTESLTKFYNSVKKRAEDIDNADGRQRIIIELYDKFFKTAFPQLVNKFGIVYTPIEIVDFIIHSVNDVLKREFSRSLTDENIHILDPFTGTGTFITRLIQSGLIDRKDMKRKYTKEIHANEIVLLAYYIATVNIENSYHDFLADTLYQPFEGICLTDTFQLGETDEKKQLFSDMFPQNSERVVSQKKAPLRVIIGNPPYSVGQKSANDNAQNQKYEKLKKRIENTYAKESNANSVKNLHNSYFKAFRWASDRLDSDGGIIAFITNSGWLNANDSAGFRKCLENEFSSIYVFNLRGAVRGRSGDSAKQEGQNVFDIVTGVAITILVKSNGSVGKTSINYTDIGDFLNRKEKLNIISTYKSISNPKIDWIRIEPNEHNDWISQRNTIYETFISMIPDKKYDITSKSIFVTYSLGIATSRDPWVYNSSLHAVKKNMVSMINFYNSQRKLYYEAFSVNKKINFNEYVSHDPTKISWNDSLKEKCYKNIKLQFKENYSRIALYRPFCKTHIYFDRDFIQRPYQQLRLFPTSETNNIVITTPGVGSVKDFYVLVTDCVRDLDTYGGTQCFPLYYYEEGTEDLSLFDSNNSKDPYIRKDGISDYILKISQKQYGIKVTKEDIFYYVYGFLHSPDYRTVYANDLKKMLPRITLIDSADDFWAFSKAGRALADLHINYEKVPPADEVIVEGAESNFFKVEKMRFSKKDQKDTIVYNSKITILNIPSEAYEYIVNGKSAIEWIMERYQVSVHKESGIRNDPNDWADEVGNQRYILDLLLSVIRVSVETVDIVKGLPNFI